MFVAERFFSSYVLYYQNYITPYTFTKQMVRLSLYKDIPSPSSKIVRYTVILTISPVLSDETYALPSTNAIPTGLKQFGAFFEHI